MDLSDWIDRQADFAPGQAALRFEGEQAYRQLAELYRAVRLYVNGFQPSMKLRTKHREGRITGVQSSRYRAAA